MLVATERKMKHDDSQYQTFLIALVEGKTASFTKIPITWKFFKVRTEEPTSL